MISIIIPAYNAEKYIRECIESVRNQTSDQWLLLIIDDGSTDETGRICDDYQCVDSRISVIHQENKGLVSARIVGVQNANTDRILFLDADDWLAENCVERILASGYESDLICFDTNVVDMNLSNVSIRKNKYSEGIYTGGKYKELIGSMIYDINTSEYHRMTPWVWNKVIKKNIANRILGELDVTLSYPEDVVFMNRYILECQSVAILHETLYNYRIWDDSMIHKVNDKALIDINKMYINLKERFEHSEYKDILMPQLEHTLVWFTCVAINEQMGLDREKHFIPPFVEDIGELKGKKVIIYGAGARGINLYKTIQCFGYDVKGIVDKNYDVIQNKYPFVESTSILDVRDYDLVVIAVNVESVANEIKKDLLDKGIAESAIMWKKPICVF